ncbi:bacteriocin [Lentzea sp. BCCO 10_0061]|uniref:Bacteriocin n=1 Tax=Lentzea sokolovensis TaxID=3095429 RepID=A0ABU4UQH0_9PSEU|nr:bacteriocin [Lentzea sp. BCCO 10_0061]MDX8141525.1 bacteriocin [Lentzea sp. BCCO 10_0061]
MEETTTTIELTETELDEIYGGAAVQPVCATTPDGVCFC